MNKSLAFRLSFMMFLEFFIWGAWFVTMGTYLSRTIQATDIQNAQAYGTQSLGAILAPFVIGLIADRYFSAQRILGALHLIGAGILYWITLQSDFSGFYPLILIYMILYMPTLALVNAVAFRQLDHPEKDFARIRVWGTLGWIIAGFVIGWLSWEQEEALVNTFRLAAGASALLGMFSFFLPNTPPGSKGKDVSIGDLIGTDALKLLKDKNYLIFFIASILICIPLAFYYQEANKFMNEIGVEKAAGKMAFGQVSEIIFMLLIPLFFRQFGVKVMLIIGMAAWGLRYVLFSYGNADDLMSFIYLGILLHGICYDFFFVTGQIYTEKRAGINIKSSAQGLITLATYGIGMYIGFIVAGQIVESYNLEVGHDWQDIWLYPAGIAATVLLLFTLFFKEKRNFT
jgi:nucleoside transporter